MRTALFQTHTSRTIGLIAAAASALAASVAVTPAATLPGSTPQLIVHYGDLNLSSDAGAQALLRRIAFAARHVCGLDSGPLPLPLQLSRERCWQQSIARAVTQLHTAKLTAAYQALYMTRPAGQTAQQAGTTLNDRTVRPPRSKS